ncbi:MAG TPA: TMEM165/GDT1 family protein, partial [Stellaceae bacterium]|nr:TMEM165/GDT1 family protein [Stellaceae bacterium]
MNAFLVSLATVAFAEIGDRTQLLSLCLAAHYRRPWPILAGILTATLVNHALAGVAGAVLARFLTPLLLNTLVGASMVAMALWTLRPDAPGGKDVPAGGHGIFFATLTLAAAYPNLIAVVA